MESIIKHKELIEHCSSKNTESFNCNKSLEEMTEFAEVVIKRQTKHPTNPKVPKKEEYIKEFGDVIYRGFVVLKQQFPELSVEEIFSHLNEHIDGKLTRLQKWKDEDKYKGGL